MPENVMVNNMAGDEQQMQKPKLTFDARLFLASARMARAVIKTVFRRVFEEHKGAEYSTFEYNARKDFVSRFPGGIEVRGKRVLDLGCGKGGETVGYAEEDPSLIVGVEIDEQYVRQAAAYAGEKLPGRPVAFVLADAAKMPFADASFDVIVSHDVFEHLSEPQRVLEECRRVLVPGGRMYLSFGPLWYSPYGGHVVYFSPVPWSHLLVPEKTMFRARSRFRDDGARSYKEAGVCKMTLKRFERLLDRCDMKVVFIERRAVKNLKVLVRIPVVRELFCQEVRCVLQCT
ncbi:MAG TPA: class I SAM-dependent methyltransferase [Planctomycetota bacterium]|nr:class I SAM-dependent methyltransferase [Planctomycetota bacterium]